MLLNFKKSDTWTHRFRTPRYIVIVMHEPLCALVCHPSQLQPFFFFVFLGPQVWHMEVPGLGVESELQLPAYTTATATRHLSLIWDLPKARGNARSLTHWAKPRINPYSHGSYLGSDLLSHNRTPAFCLIHISAVTPYLSFLDSKVRHTPKQLLFHIRSVPCHFVYPLPQGSWECRALQALSHLI